MGAVRNNGTKDAPLWYARYMENGRRVEKPTKQPTRALALRYLAEVEARIGRGAVGIPEFTDDDKARRRLTVDDLALRFLGEAEGIAGHASPRLKDLAEYRRQARSVIEARILPSLTNRAAASITSADVEKLRDALIADHFAGASVNKTMQVLSKMFTWGRKAKVIDCANPVVGVERPREIMSLDFYDAAEVGRLLARVEEHAPDLYPMVATAIYCGLRKGEIFGLRWIDVSLDAARLDVNRSYAGLPKGGKPRHLPLHPELVTALRAWRKRCPETEEHLVFPLPGLGKGQWRMGRCQDGLGLAAQLVAAGCHVPAKPWHALRHTFASHFIMRGGNILTLQKLLGHAKIDHTLVYAHLAPDFMAVEVARLTFARPNADNVLPIAKGSRRGSR